MNLRTLSGLIVCNLIWSLHPVMGKELLLTMPPASVGWLRYVSAALAYVLIAVPLRQRWPARVPALFYRPRDFAGWMLILFTGFMAFCYSPYLTFQGLAQSRASDGAIIVAMEPLMSTVLAWAFLRERLSGHLFGAFAIALIGFALLSGVSFPGASFAEGADGVLGGNVLMLAALIGEASYPVTGKKLLVKGEGPLAVFGSSIFLGVMCLTAVLLVAHPSAFAEAFAGLNGSGWFALLWLGPLGTTATYLYWMVALRSAPVASLALTLFVQPVCGALWGAWFLNERLNLTQALGALLILGAVFYQSWVVIRQK